jgi:hypothetical protein
MTCRTGLSTAVKGAHLHATAFVNNVKGRWKQLDWTDDGGYATETVLVTALVVVIALAAIAVLGAKVLAKVTGINL